MQKEGTIQEYEDRIRALAEKPSLGKDDGFSLSMFGEQAHLFTAPLPAPMAPFDMSVQTNTQAFINNMSVNQGTAFSAYNPFFNASNPQQLLQPTSQFPQTTSTQLPLPAGQFPLPVNQFQGSTMQLQTPVNQFQPATTQFQTPTDQVQSATDFQLPVEQPQQQTAHFQGSAEQFQLQSPTNHVQPVTAQFQAPNDQGQSASEFQLPAEQNPPSATQLQAPTEQFQPSTPQLQFPDAQSQSSSTQLQPLANQAQSSTQFQVPAEQFQSSNAPLQSPVEQFQSSTPQMQASVEQFQPQTVQTQLPTNQFQSPVEPFQSSAGQFQSPSEQLQFPSTPFQPTPAQFQSPNPQFQSTPGHYQTPCPQFQPSPTQFQVPGFQFPVSSMQFQMPAPNTTIPNNNNWFQSNANYAQSYSPCVPYPPYHPMGAPGGAPGPTYQSVPLSSTLRSLISVEDRDRSLLDHFVDNVLRLIFPIIGVHQGGTACINEILKLMQSNRSYLHCCLSAGAIHLKTSMGMEDQMDHDIMQHRYAAISQLSGILGRGSGHMQILDATLAMILYHCSVGTTDDYLPDVPWTTHFQAVTSIIKKLNCAPNQFNISLISWIDILGSTMLGTTPEFSHTHRTKHLSGTPSGLQQLMGCDDKVMYLISEIACLEALKIESGMDELTIYSHVSALTAQIDYSEPADATLESPFDANGAIKQDMLTKIITTLFRIAARIYLFSLTPGFDYYEPSIVNQVKRVGEILQYLPSGPRGFDRSLVWPLFIVGVHSVPTSAYRKTLAERVVALGYMSDFGSFGRMYRVLKEIWKETNPKSKTKSKAKPKAKPKPKPKPKGKGKGKGRAKKDAVSDSEESDLSASDSDEEEAPQPSSSKATGKQPERPGEEKLHWRDIMRRKKWNYLLL
ncbi:fungal-specific transcription factor domain-containing protein [Aspergillus alliaceus]|uniref:Fungal-specific transcription factor domain-containing protein n=1 Tax=Petromyces alliaceus TaxID=209559 RepID=A0A5N7BTS1_PETAA|nr:fungal-specific transcription factor domain-containing protein [Aspergillus alliaceus]